MIKVRYFDERRRDEEREFADAAAFLLDLFLNGYGIKVFPALSGDASLLTYKSGKGFARFVGCNGHCRDIHLLVPFAEVAEALRRWILFDDVPRWKSIRALTDHRPIPDPPQTRPSLADAAIYLTGWLLGHQVDIKADEYLGTTLGVLVLEALSEQQA